MSIEEREQGNYASPLQGYVPLQDCDVATLSLLLNHVCRTDLVYPWLWEFKKHFKLVIPLPAKKTVVKEEAISDFVRTVHPEDRKSVVKELEQIIKNKKDKFECVFRSDYLLQDHKWYKMTGEVIGDRHSTDYKAVGIIQNIHERVTKRKENEELLVKAQKKVEIVTADRNLALDNLNTALVYVNRDFIVRWSSMQTMKKLMGEDAYAKGIPCYASTFHRTEPCQECPVQRMFESRQTESKRIVMRDETIEVTVNPVNKEGSLVGGILKLDKITERVKQEETIQKLNTLMDAILNHIPVALFVKNPNDNFKYLYWNETLAGLTKIPASKVIGFTDEEIFEHKDEVELFRDNDTYVLETGGKVSFIEEYTAPNGENVVVSSLKTIIPTGKGEKPWILGISWDITDLKRVEKELIRLKDKAEESNRLKSSFLANMSHEIRTPLNAIVGFSELLIEVGDTQEREDYINIIKRNNQLLLQLVSDILDLSKIESGSLEFNFSSVNIHKFISQTITTQNLDVKAQVPVILEKHIPDLILYTDKNRVNQVLFNLINNAQKFTSTGQISVGYYHQDERNIYFYVRDTGAGIEPDKLGNIFERFIKLDSFKQGTGLGLAICRSIIEQLGGTIGVESELGKGSCFWFTLPINPDKIISGKV